MIEANKMHYFSTLFRYTTLHVSDRLTVHHQEPASEVRMELDKYLLLFLTSRWDIPVVLYRIIDINNIQSNTAQLIILLRCISYIVSFNDMFRL